MRAVGTGMIYSLLNHWQLRGTSGLDDIVSYEFASKKNVSMKNKKHGVAHLTSSESHPIRKNLIYFGGKS